MSELHIALLGPPAVVVDGSPLQVDTRKAVAVLAYLAMSDKEAPRDSLAGLLWPDFDQESARGALRRTLSTLKKGLEGGWLRADRTMVALENGDLLIDVESFNSCIEECRQHGHESSQACPRCLGPLSRAAGLYRGDFMAGFALRDSPAFEEWQFFQAESLRRALASSLELLIQCLVDAGDFNTAIDHARRWLALDPLHEPAHRRLMELYSWGDQRAAALKQYRECVALLDRELGVTPLEYTTILYQAIKEDRVPEPPVPPPPDALPSEQPKPTDAISSGWPLVGRARELATLVDAYSSAGNTGRLVVIEGEAGIGKTRLAEEFAAHARDNGSCVLWTRCHEDETDLAYGSVTELMRAAMRECSGPWVKDLAPHWLAEVARIVPEVAAHPSGASAGELDSPGAQGRFYEGITQFLLAACAREGTGVLVVDDVHNIDEPSLGALAYLVRRLGGRSLCVLFTWRSEEVPYGHRIRRIAAETDPAESLKVRRLDKSNVAELARLARSESSPQLERRLYEETEGIPFFVVQYLDSLTADVSAPSGTWTTPEGVRELLRSRLDAVGETAWQVLTAAAVIGRSFGFDVVREASGRSDDETVAALEELTGLKLVQEVAIGAQDRAPVFDFLHEKVRSLVQEDIGSARRRLLHRRIAESLARSSRAGAQAALAARHFELAGHYESAIHHYLQAAAHARGLYANAQALALYESALALNPPEPARLHESIGDMHTLLGNYSAAITSYETAAALAGEEDIGRIDHKLGRVHDRRGDWSAAASHFAEAMTRAADDSQRARITADRSLAAHRRGDEDLATELAEEALGLAEKASDPEALAQAHNILGILAAGRSDLEVALDHLQHSVELAKDLKDPSAHVAALNNLALAQRRAGDFDASLVSAREALRICTSQRDRHREAALRNNIADILHLAGEEEESQVQMKKAVAIFAEVGSSETDMRPEIWKLVEW